MIEFQATFFCPIELNKKVGFLLRNRLKRDIKQFLGK
jgi:hypothetical protein